MRSRKILREQHVVAPDSKPDVLDDFGRSLPYYAPFYRMLLAHSHKKIKGKRLLHIGSSTGLFTRFLQDKGVKSVALDLDAVASKTAKKIGNKQVVRAMATIENQAQKDIFSIPSVPFLPFKSESFDFLISDHFLFSALPGIGDLSNKNPKSQKQKVAGSMRLLKEIHRILKRGGLVVVNCNKLSTELIEIIENDGFTIIAQSPHSRRSIKSFVSLNPLQMVVLQKK